jgi:hypothetical protein
MRTSRRNCANLIAVVFVAGALDARIAAAQSLGAVARQEADRRNQQAQGGKVYTNEDLDALPPADAPAAPAEPPKEPAAPVTTTKPSGVVIEENPGKGTLNMNAPAPASNRDEKYWRRRSRDLRQRLAALNTNIATTQQRLAALEDGPQTPAATRDRQALTTALEQLRGDLHLRNEDIAQLRTFAESQKVPPAWLELE